MAISMAGRGDLEKNPEAGWTTGERIVAKLVAVLRQVGEDVQPLFDRANITCPPNEFSTGACRRFGPERLHHLYSLAGTALSTHVARRAGREPLRTADWRMLFLCLAGCRTLRQAMQRADEFVSILNGRCGRMELIESGSTAEFRIDSEWPFQTVPSLVVDMIGILTTHSLFSWLIARTVPVTVLMSYPASMLDVFDSGMLPYPTATECSCNGFRFATEYLDYPILRRSEDCENALGTDLAFPFDVNRERALPDVSGQVRRILFQALSQGYEPPTLEATAMMVSQSRASLRRQLSRKGQSYRDIKDSCRREIAMDLLSRTDLGIEDIAVRLSYCDSDAFRRSFGKWIGMAPSQFRKVYAARARSLDYPSRS